MQFQWAYASAVRNQTTCNIYFTRRTTRFDAQGNSGELTTTPDQGGHATISLDGDEPDPADGLADLNADRPIGVGDNALELRGPDCSGIDIKAARALAECFDRRIDLKHVYSAEIDEPDTAWPSDVIFSSTTQRSTTPQLSRTRLGRAGPARNGTKAEILQ